MTFRLIIAAVVFWFALLSGGGSDSAAADSADLLEYKVKTAFLFNFAKFVEWPETSFTPTSEEFVIGIIAPQELASTTKILNNKLIKGLRVKLIFFDSPEEISPCHLLFIGIKNKSLVRAVISRFKERPVLTVADIEGFASQGGVINFITVDNTIHFEINPEAAKEKHLKISSKLLSLARIVQSVESKGTEE